MQEFNEWNKVKIRVSNVKKVRLFKERDIFYINMGKNIGHEQNGKGHNFVRPIVIVKKISNEMLLAIPLSTQIKEGSWFFRFDFIKKDTISENIAILPQIRMYSTKRLLNKIGVMKKDDFIRLKKELVDFIS